MKSANIYTALKPGAAMAVLSIALASTAAFAQETNVGDATAEEAETIVVTGSLLRSADTQTPSPITVISSETLDRAGITNIADALRQASADGAGSIGLGFTSGFSAGGAAVSLRNLGVSSTLVLVDGLRSAQYPLSDDGHNSYVDLNSIPQVNLERVEVLKDGASST
jgi:iron complex outermembrane receptor protein